MMMLLSEQGAHKVSDAAKSLQLRRYYKVAMHVRGKWYNFVISRSLATVTQRSD